MLQYLIVACQYISCSRASWFCPSVGIEDLFRRLYTRDFTRRTDVYDLLHQVRSALSTLFPQALSHDQQDASEAMTSWLNTLSNSAESDMSYKLTRLMSCQTVMTIRCSKCGLERQALQPHSFIFNVPLISEEAISDHHVRLCEIAKVVTLQDLLDSACVATSRFDAIGDPCPSCSECSRLACGPAPACAPPLPLR